MRSSCSATSRSPARILASTTSSFNLALWTSIALLRAFESSRPRVATLCLKQRHYHACGHENANDYEAQEEIEGPVHQKRLSHRFTSFWGRWRRAWRCISSERSVSVL